MCGVAGIFSQNALEIESIIPMIEPLHHRGPDKLNYKFSQKRNILFGHTRLSIIDLSDGGSQPMVTNSGRFLISFNGEIYNFNDLRAALFKYKKNIKYRGKSDTEVLLNYIEFFGIEKALNDTKGMFAFALWDELEQSLILARDRAGEKPLYYGNIEGNLYFASELKAIKNKIQNLKISQDAIRLMLKYNCIPAPYSIYENVYKVEPSNYLKFVNPTESPRIKNYFSPEVLDNDISHSEYLSKFESLMNNSVKSQMISDVPIGSFLSGGVDSALVTCFMQQNSNKPVNTYSIGFKDQTYDEAPYSKMIAKTIGTNHHELYIDDSDMKEFVYKLPEIYCEPFSDSSQIPTYFVSKFASDSVKVCLTGDAGDELFGGYNRYLFAQSHWKKIDMFPILIKNIFSKLLLNVPSNRIEAISQKIYTILRR